MPLFFDAATCPTGKDSIDENLIEQVIRTCAKDRASRTGTDLRASDKRDAMAEELADVTIYCIYLEDALGIDLADAVSAKIDANAQKYPIDKARGNSRKYTELQS